MWRQLSAHHGRGAHHHLQATRPRKSFPSLSILKQRRKPSVRVETKSMIRADMPVATTLIIQKAKKKKKKSSHAPRMPACSTERIHVDAHSTAPEIANSLVQRWCIRRINGQITKRRTWARRLDIRGPPPACPGRRRQGDQRIQDGVGGKNGQWRVENSVKRYSQLRTLNPL